MYVFTTAYGDDSSGKKNILLKNARENYNIQCKLNYILKIDW